MLQSIAITAIIAGLLSSFGVAVSQETLGYPISVHTIKAINVEWSSESVRIIQQPISEPPQPPPDDDIDLANLRGVNFMDPVLGREQKQTAFTTTQDKHVNTYIPKLKQFGFNLIRLPVIWESYELNRQVFLDQLELVVTTAKQSGIYVTIDFHHFQTTSYWRSAACLECGDYHTYGSGFPTSVVSKYHPTTDYEHDPEVEAFWLDYYANNVRGVTDVWQKQANVMKAIISKIDKYDNVIGYEILNEPHFFNEGNYAQLGKLHTFIGNEMREVTDKAIIFTRETGQHGFQRVPNLEPLILPKVSGKLIYAPHIYSIENVDVHIGKWKQYQNEWKQMGYSIALGVGEWAMQPPQTLNPTQTLSDNTIREFRDNGMFWTYWAYAGFMQEEGNVMMERDGTLTEVGEYVINSIKDLY